METDGGRVLTQGVLAKFTENLGKAPWSSSRDTQGHACWAEDKYACAAV